MFAYAAIMRAIVTKCHLLGGVAIACAAMGCVQTHETFLPAGPSVIAVDGTPATRYEVPGGNVVVASLPVRDQNNHQLIGVQMRVSNEYSAEPFVVDVREQSATLGPNPELPEADPKPDVVLTRTGSNIVSVERGKEESIDFYFPAPAPAPNTQPVRQIAFNWTLQAGRDTVARQTNLYRARLTPVSGLNTDSGDALGHLWYDPDWNNLEQFYPPLILRWRIAPQW
jgi:hypothetical protein